MEAAGQAVSLLNVFCHLQTVSQQNNPYISCIHLHPTPHIESRHSQACWCRDQYGGGAPGHNTPTLSTDRWPHSPISSSQFCPIQGRVRRSNWIRMSRSIMRLGHHHCTVYWGGEGRGWGCWYEPRGGCGSCLDPASSSFEECWGYMQSDREECRSVSDRPPPTKEASEWDARTWMLGESVDWLVCSLEAGCVGGGWGEERRPSISSV